MPILMLGKVCTSFSLHTINTNYLQEWNIFMSPLSLILGQNWKHDLARSSFILKSSNLTRPNCALCPNYGRTNFRKALRPMRDSNTLNSFLNPRRKEAWFGWNNFFWREVGCPWQCTVYMLSSTSITYFYCTTTCKQIIWYGNLQSYRWKGIFAKNVSNTTNCKNNKNNKRICKHSALVLQFAKKLSRTTICKNKRQYNEFSKNGMAQESSERVVWYSLSQKK